MKGIMCFDFFRAFTNMYPVLLKVKRAIVACPLVTRTTDSRPQISLADHNIESSQTVSDVVVCSNKGSIMDLSLSFPLCALHLGLGTPHWMWQFFSDFVWWGKVNWPNINANKMKELVITFQSIWTIYYCTSEHLQFGHYGSGVEN